MEGSRGLLERVTLGRKKESTEPETISNVEHAGSLSIKKPRDLPITECSSSRDMKAARRTEDVSQVIEEARGPIVKIGDSLFQESEAGGGACGQTRRASL